MKETLELKFRQGENRIYTECVCILQDKIQTDLKTKIFGNLWFRVFDKTNPICRYGVFIEYKIK